MMSVSSERVRSGKPQFLGGYVRPDFEPVREAFVDNFKHRGELGAACCVYYRGEKVVDLWGGIRNKSTGEPWEEDTMALVFSTTKGLAGLAMALAHSRGLYEYDERVCRYWPEFAQEGKEKVTVRQLLAHQAGLFSAEGLGDRALVADPDRLASAIAARRPEWDPGSRQGYHAITIGYYESELLRRVDPLGRTLGRYFQDEVATPLGIDFYIRLPDDVPNSRLAVLQPASMALAIFTMPFPLFVSAFEPGSPVRRALVGSDLPLDPARIYARNFEVPAGGGVGTARAIARAYGVFSTGGTELGLGPETLRELTSPPRPPTHGFHDEVLKVEIPFALGFARPGPKNPFGHPTSFGAPGTGGSFGFADPEARLGYGYVPNQGKAYLMDPRDGALRNAMYESIGERDPYFGRG